MFTYELIGLSAWLTPALYLLAPENYRFAASHTCQPRLTRRRKSESAGSAPRTKCAPDSVKYDSEFNY